MPVLNPNSKLLLMPHSPTHCCSPGGRELTQLKLQPCSWHDTVACTPCMVCACPRWACQVDGAGFLSCSAFMSCWAFCAIMLPSICVSWAAFLAIAPMKSPNWITRVQVAQGSGWYRWCMVGTAGGRVDGWGGWQGRAGQETQCQTKIRMRNACAP